MFSSMFIKEPNLDQPNAVRRIRPNECYYSSSYLVAFSIYFRDESPNRHIIILNPKLRPARRS